jgi:PAS domain S-box-containing protein
MLIPGITIVEFAVIIAALMAMSLFYSDFSVARIWFLKRKNLTIGVILGLASAVPVMIPAQQTETGWYGYVWVLLPLAGIFGNWLSAVTAGIIPMTALIISGNIEISLYLVMVAGIAYGYLRTKIPWLNRSEGFIIAGVILFLVMYISGNIMQTSGFTIPDGNSNFYSLVFYGVTFVILSLLFRLQEYNRQKQTEAYQLKDRYLGLYECSPFGVIVVDKTGEIRLNPAAEDIFGYDRNSFRKEYLSILFETFKISEKTIAHEEAADTGRMMLHHKNGSPVFVELTTRFLSVNSDELTVFFVKDVTSQAGEKSKLIRELSLLKEAERLTYSGHWEYDPETKKLFVSKEASSILNFEGTSSRSILRHLLRHTAPEERQKVTGAFRKAAGELTPMKYEIKYISASGKHKLLKHIISTNSESGSQLRIFGVITDITDQLETIEKAHQTQLNLEKLVESRTQDVENSRKAAINLLLDANEQRMRAEEALKQLEESHSEILKLSQAVEQSLAAVAITNTDGEVEYVNHTFVEYTGYSKQEILGQKLHILRSSETPEDFYENIWKTIRNGDSWKGEFHNRHKSGLNYWESVVISPIFNEKNETVYFVKVAQDITDRKKLEKDLIEARDKADLATRAKSEFLANVSHEIRTPMNAILGFADLLTYSISDTRSLDYLESLKVSGKNLLSLINDILDLSKVEAGMLKINKEFIDFRQLVKEIEQIFSLKISEKGLNLIIDIQDGFPRYIYTDETRLRQVLLNLVSNAVKYTDSGHILIKARQTKLKEEPSGPESRQTDFNIQVIDTGSGISDEFQKLIFQSFTQEESHDRKKQGGTGLGLAISKKLADLLGGEISVNSRSGEGSIFTLQFNDITVSDDYYIQPMKTSFTWDDIRFEKSTILIVDDMEDNLKFLGNMLEYAGIKIIAASNGEQALNILRNENPDLIITDIRMPVMDGFELFNHLKSNEFTSKIPVIAASASVMNNQETEENLAKFDGYLLKPIQTSELIDNLMKHLPCKIVSDPAYPPSKHIIPSPSMPVIIQPEAMAVLQVEAMQLWSQIRERQPVRKVDEFGRLIVATGERWNIPELKKFGNDLLMTRKNFNVEAMVKLIREFPDLLTGLTANDE